MTPWENSEHSFGGGIRTVKGVLETTESKKDKKLHTTEAGSGGERKTGNMVEGSGHCYIKGLVLKYYVPETKS